MGVQVNKLTNANFYVNGDSLLGSAKEVELPTINQVMADYEALGMIGKVSLPSGFEKLEGKIMWNSIYRDVILKVANPNIAYQCQLRGNLESHTSEGLAAEVPYVVYLTLRFRGLPAGNFKQHENTELETEFDATYLRMEIDGEEIMEYDALSNIYTVGGVDITANYRANIGG